MVKVTISARGKPPSVAKLLPISIDLSQDATIRDAKQALAKQFPKVSAFEALFNSPV
jgi:very-long-chain enoyl-CoA reductase